MTDKQTQAIVHYDANPRLFTRAATTHTSAVVYYSAPQKHISSCSLHDPAPIVYYSTHNTLRQQHQPLFTIMPPPLPPRKSSAPVQRSTHTRLFNIASTNKASAIVHDSAHKKNTAAAFVDNEARARFVTNAPTNKHRSLLLAPTSNTSAIV